MQRRAEYIAKHGEPSPAEQQMRGTLLLEPAPERHGEGIDEPKVK